MNVGSLEPCDYIALAKLYREARFIITDNGEEAPTEVGEDGSA